MKTTELQVVETLCAKVLVTEIALIVRTYIAYHFVTNIATIKILRLSKTRSAVFFLIKNNQ
jgi:hypothetical protein